jgi:hypothetical protein
MSQRAVVVAAAKAYLLQWTRSRALISLAVLVALLFWYDNASLRRGPDVWALLPLVVGWSGFLVGYDTYNRLRTDGSLRLLLLQRRYRAQLALGFVAGGAMVGFAAIIATIGYLLVSGRVETSPSILSSIPIALIAVTGWVVYSQLLSLVVPKDTAAVLGFMVLIFGTRTPDRWVPDGLPESVGKVVAAVWAALPTSVRLDDVLNGRDVFANVSVQLIQIACAFALLSVLLSRRALLARQQVDA